MSMTARELCETLEIKLKRVWDDARCQRVGELWDSGQLSDHLPHSWISPHKRVAVVTWNVFDYAYVNYMTSEKDGGQGLHQHPIAKAENQAARLNETAKRVVHYAANNYIVCLQEVCNELLDLIRIEFETTPDAFAIHRTRIDEEDSNQLLVIYAKAAYRILGEHVLWGPGVGRERFVTNYYSLETCLGTPVKFNIANVHLSFGTNAMCRDQCKKVFVDDAAQLPAIVCGDFNATCRMPPGSQIEGDHILDVYDDAAFMFAAPASAPPYTHVNRAENVTGPDRQLDMFDHVMLMNDAHKLL
jgi:hypothetical protein